jgi:predicted ATPase
MLSKVHITNYRGFKSYSMQDLAQVNLLVGKNNSGKTAILEGIQFLASGGDPSVLSEVAERRGELILARPEGPHAAYVEISHFFYGHALSLDNSFCVSGDNGYQPVTVKTVAQSNSKEASEARRERTGTGGSGVLLKILKQGRPDKEAQTYNITREGGVVFDSPQLRFRRSGVQRQFFSGPPVRFVGPDSLNTFEMAHMWDEITLTGQELDVAAAMRVLEPNLDSIHFLTGMLASGYFPSRAGIVLALKEQSARLPMGSMGDGMRRMMALATALAFTKEGCLFVDEIDTGLHYSVMSNMWNMVVNKAISSNTQVFATTHSWDCIEGLSFLCDRNPELKSKVAIHKIDRAIPHSVAFSGDSIVKMAKGDIDPR